MRTIPGNGRAPARKASAATSLAALYTAVRHPPPTPAARASSIAGNTSCATGSNSQVEAVAKSRAGAASAIRCGQPSASAMGSFIDGGDAWARVEPSVKVTIECTIDCGCTVTSIRS